MAGDGFVQKLEMYACTDVVTVRMIEAIASLLLVVVVWSLLGVFHFEGEHSCVCYQLNKYDFSINDIYMYEYKLTAESEILFFPPLSFPLFEGVHLDFTSSSKTL